MAARTIDAALLPRRSAARSISLFNAAGSWRLKRTVSEGDVIFCIII
jgi:hypothetical protein